MIANEATVCFVMSLYLAAAILQGISVPKKKKKAQINRATLAKLAHSNVEVSRQCGHVKNPPKDPNISS